jgi:hypothetical protein
MDQHVIRFRHASAASVGISLFNVFTTYWRFREYRKTPQSDWFISFLSQLNLPDYSLMRDLEDLWNRSADASNLN